MHDEAIDFWKQLLKQEPGDQNIQWQLARAFEQKGQGAHDKVIEIWKKMLEREPGDQGIQRRMARAFKHKRALDEARN